MLRGRHQAVAAIGFIILFAAIGVGLLLAIHAATSSDAKEAESGVLGGAATKTTDATASGAAAVRFQPASSITAPTGLKGVTGGADIALVWHPGTAIAGKTITGYEVYRDNVKLSTVPPGIIDSHYNNGVTRYIDAAIAAGTTHSYQVRAVANDGSVSALTASISVRRPLATETTPVPTVTVDTSAAPDLAGYVQDFVVPIIKTWYPKLVDAMARGAYSPPNSVKLVFLPGYQYVASSADGTITIQPEYARANPTDNFYVHEMGHLVGVLPASDRAFWAVEGIADYFNNTLYQKNDMSLPTAGQNYTDGYEKSAYLIRWIAKTYNLPTFPRDLAVTIHTANSAQTDAFVQAKTGKTPAELWAQMMAQGGN